MIDFFKIVKVMPHALLLEYIQTYMYVHKYIYNRLGEFDNA